MNGKNVYLQYLRALAIIAVITIHVSTVNQGNGVIILRQLVNYCVALFLFLSGYLTNKDSVNNLMQFYKKRIIKVLIPYFIWSIFYIAISKNYDIKSIMVRLITGQGCSIYYYIIVYIQLVILTPILLKLLHTKINKYIGLLTPISLLFLYLLTYFNKPIFFPYNVLSFTVWILFYYYGLQVKNLDNIEEKLHKNIAINIVIYVICLSLSLIEGFMWNKANNISMAVSQTKITSMFTSIYLINIVIGIKGKLNFKSNILKIIGDYSFGIYLTHLLFIKVIDIIYRKIGGSSSNILYIPIIVVSVLILNCAFIFIVNRLIGYKSRYLGFTT